MLVLTREPEEEILIGGGDSGIPLIRVKILEVRNGTKVRVGITAPTGVPVHRSEVYEAIERENARNQKPQ